MKTIHLFLAVVVASVGLGSAKAKPAMVTTSSIDNYCVTYDTFPNKTVYRDVNTGEAVDIWYDAGNADIK